MIMQIFDTYCRAAEFALQMELCMFRPWLSPSCSAVTPAAGDWRTEPAQAATERRPETGPEVRNDGRESLDTPSGSRVGTHEADRRGPEAAAIHRQNGHGEALAAAPAARIGEDTRIQLREEQLHVGKQLVAAGEVLGSVGDAVSDGAEAVKEAGMSAYEKVSESLPSVTGSRGSKSSAKRKSSSSGARGKSSDGKSRSTAGVAAALPAARSAAAAVKSKVAPKKSGSTSSGPFLSGALTTMARTFELKKTAAGKYHFVLKAGNGEVILSSEHYEAKAGAEKGIASVRANAPDDARYERRESKRGEPYFVLKAGNGEIIGQSEMYSTASGRDNGIASVQRHAPDARLKDLTETNAAPEKEKSGRKTTEAKGSSAKSSSGAKASKASGPSGSRSAESGETRTKRSTSSKASR